MFYRQIQKKKVLIIEKRSAKPQALKSVLENHGYYVELAHTAQEARKRRFAGVDLILMGLKLPDMAPDLLCRKLKRSKKTRHIPIVMLNTKYFVDEKCIEKYLGADDHFIRPLEKEELFSRIESVVLQENPHDVVAPKDSRKDVISELRSIIEEERITAYYQPIFSLKNREVFGVEVLARPITETSLSNLPFLFEKADQYGLYHKLETICWEKGVKGISGKLKDKKLFLNCNPPIIHEQKFLGMKDVFDRNQIPTTQVVLEITEHLAISNYKTFYNFLSEYRAYGFSIAMDDVGGGYSGLESIIETKPEIIKIDRHIVSGLSKDPLRRSVVKFIVSFCKENNITSVAEGIETRDDLVELIELGVDCGQGMFLHPPTEDADLDKMKRNAGFSKI